MRRTTAAALRTWNALRFTLPQRLRGNRVLVGAADLRGCRLDLSGGDTVVVGDRVRLRGVRVVARGGGNTLLVADDVKIARGCVLWAEEGGRLRVGDRTTIESAHCAATEGRELAIGADCMLATGIEVRTGDSHSLVDPQGRRLNRAADVVIADRVWIGARALVLKGVRLDPDTTVAAGAVVTRSTDEPGTVLAGNPARPVRRATAWLRERIA